MDDWMWCAVGWLVGLCVGAYLMLGRVMRKRVRTPGRNQPEDRGRRPEPTERPPVPTLVIHRDGEGALCITNDAGREVKIKAKCTAYVCEDGT